MKVRLKVLLVLCLLLLAAAWFFWPAHDRSAFVAKSATPPTVAPIASAASASSNSLATASATSHSAADLTNRLAFRLTNTTKTIGELTKMPHAILLQNALLDTDAKLDLNIPKQLQAGTEPGAFIVQARGVIEAPFRAAIADAGGQIVSYIPNNAYLVRLSSAGAAVLSGNGLVQAVLPYEPYYKVNPSLLGLAVEQLPLTPGTALTLGLFATDTATAEAQLTALGAKVIGQDQSPFGPVLRVLPPADWTALARSPLVQVMEPAYRRMAANDLARVTLGVTTDSQTTSNYLGLTGANVLVAVNDSGIDATHPDLMGRVFGPDLTDTAGHGTHVAGIIAGNGTESLTVSNAQGSIMPPTNGQFRGMAPFASLYSFNYGNSDYAMQTNAAGQGALISNNSWTYGGDFDYDLAAASYDAATRDALPYQTGSQPVLFVFAAGGSGGGNSDGSGGSADTIESPGTAKNVITVGALEQLRHITNLVTVVNADGTTNQSEYWYADTDSGTQVADYSSRGNVGVGTEGAYGRFKPDVVAPGTFLVSTRSSQWDTNAYFNPTNADVQTYPGQLVLTNGLNYYTVTVPANAVSVTIAITPNQLSNPFPADLPIYVKQSTYPTTTVYDYETTKNNFSVPPDAPIAPYQNNGFYFAVGNSTNVPVSYDLTVSVYTTNNVGDLYAVLLGMDNLLGPYYRYETGTSMSAAGVSGVLALIDGYFTNQLDMVPSPALLKAMLINGSQTVGSYGYSVTNGVNLQGWGVANIAGSLPLTATNLTSIGANSPLFFVDQSPTNALATGDSHTYFVTLDTNNYANYLPLKATLVWTDPCGDPAAAIKLVNNLDLIITNLATGEVYFGNDISPETGYNLPWNTNSAPNLDSINNVENIILSPNQELLAGSYSITVVGRAVNVNAVTAQTNNVVQDYALVVSVGSGQVQDAITSVTDHPILTNPTGDQLITVITTTNTPLFNQIAGASSPLLGTNTLPLGTNTEWGSSGQLTIGMTNQWHFYIVTNTGLSLDYTNAAFITFQATTLSIPRMGVYADSVADATRPEGDIDLYVTTDPGLTNLNPMTISNCLAGVGDNRSSLGQGGTEFAYYTDSTPGDVYYVGVKSEDREAVEYAFLPVFTATPFSSLDQNGNQIVNGLLLPVLIPDGTTARPGVAYVFSLAILPMQVANVTVNDSIQHQNFGDLFGALTFGTTSVVLNNHDGFGNTVLIPKPLSYDDSRDAATGTTNTDGPGSLVNYRGQSALGPWILTEADNSAGDIGQVSQFSLLIQPHRDLLAGAIVTVPAHGWFVDYVDVAPGYTNLTFNVTNLSGALTPPTPPLQMYEKLGNEPTAADYDQTAGVTNCLFGTYPTGLDPGNSISVGPPLDAGRYFIGIYNPSAFPATNVFVSADLGFDVNSSDTFTFSTNPAAILTNDAVSGSSLFVGATQLVSSVNVGLVVNSPNISDYTFTLVSPTGQRILLMENRGGDTLDGAGGSLAYTNVVNSTATGNAAANTNYLEISSLGGSVPITYDFYTVPDQMTVYEGTNLSLPPIFDTGLTNNPNGPVTVNVATQPGFTNLIIIMNQFGNPGNARGDAWTYTAGAAMTNYQYLVFTDDTNLATVPIKFAVPPYNFTELNTNYTLSDFELATNGNYFGPTNVYDAYGGWNVPTNLVVVTTVLNPTNGQFEVVTNVTVLTNNLVSVVTDPADSLGDNVGSNFLALAYGTITRSIPTIPGQTYNLRFWDRGPGIASWWRGEGNAGDSSDPENNGNNGALVGRFNFPAGEVGQAFGFQDGGSEFQFAGTNTYVQVPQNPSLDVGQGGGFTVEGWINPTNLTQPQPLVEWLAKVPTNTLVTNLVIQAGPYLNPATGHYYYMLGATNWTASEDWAEALGGHLVTLNDANEQNWVWDNFANYGGVNHNLWIGLTNSPPAAFGWISGQTNVTYVNWQSTQPDNSCGTANYTAMLGGTNQFAGLWFLADDNGFTCAAPTVTNKIYGVVEVDNLQTNGVQFWISARNTPDTTNLAFADTNGCLYANIVDTNFVAHEIYSAPGLLQSNVYQHVALTFDTNSGLAMLYLNGTNVAVTNLFLTTGTFTPFVPKTDGDVLLGRDMSRATNNYYGGEMDEMSIYNRALSGAELAGIYRVSATATNGLTGKFDPSVTPATGLSEAAVILGSSSNVIYGVNNSWQLNSYTFTATSNSMPLQITGLQPGILLDSFDVSEAPLTNLYYLPEQDLSTLTGNSAQGTWTLQVWDNLANAYVTNLSQLVSWQLNFVLESNATIAASLTPEAPTLTTVGPGQTTYYAVPVPLWAHFATNILVSSTYPVNLYFNATNPPNGSNPNDITLLTASTGGTSPAVTVNLAPPYAPYQAGQTYYLGVYNPGVHAASVVLEVDYDIPALSNGVPVTAVLTTNVSDAVQYFSYDVSSNAYEATFQLLNLSGNADLVVSKGTPLPTLTSSDYGSFNPTNLDENIYVFTNSSPVPLSAGRWYLGVVRRDAGPVNYTVLAKELDANTVTNIIELTNGVPVNFTAGPGAALTNFFHFAVTNMVIDGVTNQGLRFALYNQSGNGDLTVQTNALPLAPPFLQSSQNPGRSPELVLVYTNDTLTNLVADWYLGVPNNETVPISFTIVAETITNAYFPAFPGATGAGGGAVGGRFGTVYHVTSTGDSGPGTLRDAVNGTNRTVVFDITGDINLLSPIVITNSYLTIAGQSAMCGGVTVAGQMTQVQSAHDVIIRDVRFRPFSPPTVMHTVWSDGFENLPTPAGQMFAGEYFGNGWYVSAGSIDVGPLGQPAYDGVNFVDLNGTSPGTIFTNVPTVTGKTYTLNFAYSQNPDSLREGIPTVTANLYLNNNLSLGVSVSSTNSSWTTLSWATTSVVFTATSPTTEIEFVSTVPGASGVLLDALSLSTTLDNGDSLQFLNTSNVIADHVSASWSANNLVSVLNSANVTVQWSIMADSLFVTNSPQQGVGSLLRYGNGALSFNHNLYADNYSGNPQVGDNLSLDFVNNVIYNWGLFPGLSGGTSDLIASPNGVTNQMNYACNYLIAGPDTALFATNYAITNIAFFGGVTNALAANWIFQTNNFIDSDTNGILNGADTQWRMFTNDFTKFGYPFPLIPVPTDEAYLAYEKVLDFAGVNMCQRDAADVDIVAKVRNQTGTLISIPPAYAAAAAQAPFLDTSLDGIPDFWEFTFAQYPTNMNNNQLSTNVNFLGYTMLEEYLAWRAGPHALTVTNAPVAVDLYQMFGNTGHLGFSVGNGVNGSVYLTNNVATNGVVIQSNTIAVFTPTNITPPYSGYASFDVYVTNADTVAYFGPVTVSVVVSAVPIPYANSTNSPPVLNTNLPDLAVNELTLLTVTNTATDANTNLTLSYALTMVVDTNAMIANNWPLTYATTVPMPVINANGVIIWTPSESQGPGVYTITTVVRDNGIPQLSATNSFHVTVNEVNTAPVLPSQTNYTVNALNLLVVTNTAMDSDIPPNPLTYQLFGPLGAMIDTNGIITWIPTLAQAPGVYTFTTVVTDTNQYALVNQSLSATNTFTVTVPAPVAPFAFTQPAQAVTGASARLNGMATPNGLPSVAWYEWGTNTAYGSNTPPVSVGAGFNVVYVPSPISGLTPNLPYHFRLVVSNNFAVVYGFDQILDEANVVAWGANYAGQISVPPSLTNAVATAGAYDHSLALKNDGTVAAWGDNTVGQATVPIGLSNLLAVAGGEYYSMALKANHTVAAWGENVFPGQTNVPPGLSNVVTIAGGTIFSLALKSDGVVAAWGFSSATAVPASLSNVVAVAGGIVHSLAIKNDGTVAAWGDDSAGQTDLPAGLSNVVAIAAGGYHNLALKSDGTVVAWGDDSAGQTNVPAGLSNVVAIAAGGFNSLALKSDGSLIGWGNNSVGQNTPPTGLTNFVAISAGYLHTLALTPQSLASLTNAIVLDLTNGVPQTNNILGGSIVYYQVNVPANADFATNSLLFANGSLDVWFSTNTPPTIAGTNDSLLFAGATNGVAILSTLSAPTNIVPSTTYYLGINNTNSFSVNYAIEVDFNLTSTNTPPQTNTVPVSDIIYTNIGGTNGFLLTWYAPSNELFQVQWSDNLPFNWQTFTNIVGYNPNYPASSTNATFTFFDNGSQAMFTGSRFYQLILLGSPSAPNPPPVLPGQTNRFVNPLNLLVVTNTATDAEVPAQTLTYTLTSTVTGTNQPAISTNGIITWTPDLLQAGTSNVFTTVVKDSGTPALTATNAFAVIVSAVPEINSVIYTNGGFLLTWWAPTNDIFQVQFSDSLVPINWQNFSNLVTYTGPVTPTNGLFSFYDNGLEYKFTGLRFYQINLVGVGLPPTPPMNTVPIGSIVVTNGNILLSWSASTNSQFNVLWTTNLANPSAWTRFPGTITSTNGMFNFMDANTPTLMKFYELILLP